MNSAESPHNSLPADDEDSERPNTPPGFIRGLGMALKELETLKKRKSQKDITTKEGEGQEIKITERNQDQALTDNPLMQSLLIKSNRILDKKIHH
jgi:hypothetical protein